MTRQCILLEAGYKCANPSCRHILTLELHHIVWVKEGGGNAPDNRITLCPNCYSLPTNAHISADVIQAWKSCLVSLYNPHRASGDQLLILYQEEQRISKGDESSQPPSFRFIGDGLAMLPGLLVSGLVDISRRFSGASFSGGGMPSFEVQLTEAGKQLVEAWLNGPEAIDASRRATTVLHQRRAATLISEEPDVWMAHVRVCGGCAWQASETQRPEMAALGKPGQQPDTEACVGSGNGHCAALPKRRQAETPVNGS
jgi:hypothetical protein